MATDALAKSNSALLALKAWIKDDQEWTPDQRRNLVRVVNDGYDHGVATLAALPGEKST